MPAFGEAHGGKHVTDDGPSLPVARVWREAEPCRIDERRLKRKRVMQGYVLGNHGYVVLERVKVPVKIFAIDGDVPLVERRAGTQRRQ